ncbi:platelet basic protein [Protobothrops mucrosquamatus]|uniref:platelet basic protein n=1 Tax=Protobothrops mucrosquamatus TaxID=103944 RepID=UPI000775DD49|nr:platelet basic protein [Protobothrops mucrosquamatus]
MDRQLFSASFLLLFLLMVLVPSTGNALPIEGNECQCNSTTSSITPASINSVHLIQSGQHCSVLQVIAVLKDGNRACLNPETQWVKRIVQVLLNRENN